jgi:quercetin 2,3-dioxygenase
MNQIRLSGDRGRTRISWLDSRHSFSFGDYYDPAFQGWGPLRVINDDDIGPGGGFPMHPHKNMEIFSWVTEGALAHRDSLGNEASIGPGRIQFMGAGRGITHSEYNPSREHPVRLLQIWIHPHTAGLDPTYEEMDVPPGSDRDQWKLLLSPDGAEGTIRIRQDARVHSSRPSAGKLLHTPDLHGRKGYLQVVEGSVRTPAGVLKRGDAWMLDDEPSHILEALDPSELLFFDLPPR